MMNVPTATVHCTGVTPVCATVTSMSVMAPPVSVTPAPMVLRALGGVSRFLGSHMSSDLRGHAERQG